MGLGFDGMNHIRELDRFLYEENGNIISNDIPVSFLSVKLGGKATNISDCVLRQEASSESCRRSTEQNVLHYRENLGPC
jgi:hypothetical protein